MCVLTAHSPRIEACFPCYYSDGPKRSGGGGVWCTLLEHKQRIPIMIPRLWGRKDK